MKAQCNFDQLTADVIPFCVFGKGAIMRREGSILARLSG